MVYLREEDVGTSIWRSTTLGDMDVPVQLVGSVSMVGLQCPCGRNSLHLAGSFAGDFQSIKGIMESHKELSGLL